MCDGGYELVGSGETFGTGLTDVESSHRPSNPILDKKIINNIMIMIMIIIMIMMMMVMMMMMKTMMM